MKTTPHKLITIGVALLIVGSVVGAGAQSGPAADRFQEDAEPRGHGLAALSPVQSADAVAPVVAYGGYIAAGGIAGLTAEFLSGDGEKVEAADAEQTKIDLYSSASGLHDAAESYLAGLHNYLSDSKEVGLMVGKNAAIRAYQNGSTEIQAEQAAKNAIEDYYSQRQVLLLQNWNNSIEHFYYMNEVALNESGVTAVGETDWDSYIDIATDAGGGGATELWKSPPVVNATLANQTDHQVKTVEIEHAQWTIEKAAPHAENPWPQHVNHTYLVVDASKISGANYSTFNYVNISEYTESWNRIENLQNETKLEAQTFVNSTYQEWGGEINESELIDPYLGSRSYSPEGDYRTWALSSYSAMGLGTPENLSTFGEMTIVEDTEQVNGILMSDGLPPNGSFEKGETYNASNLAGYQYVVGSSQTWELEGEFSIVEMTNAEGETMNKTVYRNVTYTTGNLSEYQQRADELAALRNDFEAMKQRAGGGPIIPGIPNPLSGTGGLLILVGAVWLVTRQRGS